MCCWRFRWTENRRRIQKSEFRIQNRGRDRGRCSNAGILDSDFWILILPMRLSNRCFAVTGLGYLPPWTVNAGFITGDEITLIIDTGANAAAASTIHGYASVARPSNRLLVLDTERHFDHIGGNGYFRERGIDVYGHASIQRTDDEFRAEIVGIQRRDFESRTPIAPRIGNLLSRNAAGQSELPDRGRLRTGSRRVRNRNPADARPHAEQHFGLCSFGRRSVLRRLPGERLSAESGCRFGRRLADLAQVTRSRSRAVPRAS